MTRKGFFRLMLLGLGCFVCFARLANKSAVRAQQNSNAYSDGTYYISASVEADQNLNLYVDSYMEVEFDEFESIDEIELDGDVDKDGGIISSASDYGDDDSPAEVDGSFSNVAAGHEYGLYAEAEGYACIDYGAEDGDGDGDCEVEYIGTTYTSVNVQSPPPLITSLSTYSVTQGDRGSLTIAGTNLVENSQDQLSVLLSGNGGPFTSSGVPTATSATFTYDFTSYPVGKYTLTVLNNEGESDGEPFTVNSPWPADSCAVSSSPKSTYSTFLSTATPGGSGSVAISFSGGAYPTLTQSVTYGPYSTPASIASNLAALITANFKQYGLTARAFGASVVYSGKSTIGSINYTITGPSISTTTTAAAQTTATNACRTAPPSPPSICGNVNPQYVLTVLTDSVSRVSEQLNYGRMVSYSLEYRPTTPGKLGQATSFQSTITEHLSNAMTYGNSFKSSVSGQFDDVLGFTCANYHGTYTTARCFTVTSNSLGNLGQVLSYDAAGTHTADYIQITPSTKTSVLNKWVNPNGTPKNISIP